jgi:Zn-dependent M16 (insulinase) family peptidase
VQTLVAFADAAQWATKATNLTTDVRVGGVCCRLLLTRVCVSVGVQDIEEAKLSVFQSVDAPLSPSEHGLQLFLNGMSDAVRRECALPSLLSSAQAWANSGGGRRYRQRLLATTQQELADVAARYVAPAQQPVRVAAVIGTEEEAELVRSKGEWQVVGADTA